jgi:hypothetical protein
MRRRALLTFSTAAAGGLALAGCKAARDGAARGTGAPEAAAYREADLRKRALTRPDARVADLLLHPDTGYWTGWTRDYRMRLIAMGEAAVHAQAGALRLLHAGPRRLADAPSETGRAQGAPTAS